MPTTSEADLRTPGCFLHELGVGRGDGCSYWVNDNCQPECIFSMYWYQESNGEVGLQRSDEWVDDTCGGMVESDTVVF